MKNKKIIKRLIDALSIKVKVGVKEGIETIENSIESFVNDLENSNKKAEESNSTNKTTSGKKVKINGRKVYNSANGKTYKSIDEASSIVGYSPSHLSKMLNGVRPNKTTCKFL